MSEKSKVAWNLIPSNFGFIGNVDPTHRLGARGDYPKLAPPACDSVTYKAALGPAKNFTLL